MTRLGGVARGGDILCPWYCTHGACVDRSDVPSPEFTNAKGTAFVNSGEFSDCTLGTVPMVQWLQAMVGRQPDVPRVNLP